MLPPTESTFKTITRNQVTAKQVTGKLLYCKNDLEHGDAQPLCLVYSLVAVAVREWAWPPGTTYGRSGNGTRRRTRSTAGRSSRSRPAPTSAAAAAAAAAAARPSGTAPHLWRRKQNCIGWCSSLAPDWVAPLSLPGKISPMKICSHSLLTSETFEATVSFAAFV